MDIIEIVKDANKLLNSIDDYYDSIPGQQSKIDSQLSDIYHFIENNNLNAIQSCKLIKQIKIKRQERRKLINNLEILKTYKDNCNKLNNKENREFLLCELNKAKKRLKTAYRNRVYTNEQFKTLNFNEEEVSNEYK